MTTSRVTRCPNCNTSFRVTQAQLRAASGSVRCGSCLEVFDARSHMMSNESSSSNTTEKLIKNPNQATAPLSKPKKTAPEAESVSDTHDGSPSDQSTDTKKEFHTLLDTLDKEHVDVHETKEKRSIRIAGWSALIMISLIGLAGQYAWFNKDVLSLDPKLRPLYTLSCQSFSCELPPVVDISSIKSLQLLIRSHPERTEGLIVDSVIMNEAEFPQPWPQLELVFTDINGQPVASRRFRPKEYLGGSLAGSREIPNGQPIRLSMEIVDPGDGAVNYQLRFLPTS